MKINFKDLVTGIIIGAILTCGIPTLAATVQKYTLSKSTTKTYLNGNEYKSPTPILKLGTTTYVPLNSTVKSSLNVKMKTFASGAVDIQSQTQTIIKEITYYEEGLYKYVESEGVKYVYWEGVLAKYYEDLKTFPEFEVENGVAKYYKTKSDMLNDRPFISVPVTMFKKDAYIRFDTFQNIIVAQITALKPVNITPKIESTPDGIRVTYRNNTNYVLLDDVSHKYFSYNKDSYRLSKIPNTTNWSYQLSAYNAETSVYTIILNNIPTIALSKADGFAEVERFVTYDYYISVIFPLLQF